MIGRLLLLFALLLASAPAWAQSAGWEAPAAASYTAGAGDSGKALSSENAPGASITVTLPAPASVGNTWTMAFSTANGRGVVVDAPAGVYLLSGQKQSTSLSLPSNDNFEYLALASDGTNFRVTAATRGASLFNGLVGAAGGESWTFLYSSGYAATAADGAHILSDAVAGGATTVTLPSTSLIPNGWTVGLYAGGWPLTVETNAVSGGSIVTLAGASVTSETVAAPPNALMLLSFDGGAFRELLNDGRVPPIGAVTNDAAALAAGFTLYETTQPFTAARTKALPVSAAQGPGFVTLWDGYGGGGTLSAADTLTICAAGGDTIDGSAAGGCAPPLAVAGAALVLYNDGAGRWHTVGRLSIGASTAAAHEFCSSFTLSGCVWTQPNAADIGAGAFGGGLLGAVEPAITGTPYTLAQNDCGQTIPFTSASAVTVTVPDFLPAGCVVGLYQSGTGAVNVVAGSGATAVLPYGYTQTAGQGAGIAVSVTSNAGGAAAIYSILGQSAPNTVTNPVNFENAAAALSLSGGDPFRGDPFQ